MRFVKHDRVNLRLTHNTLYWSIMNFAMFGVGLALSYWFGPAPTFNPYDINRNYVALAFALYGVWQIVFINIHYLLMVRIGLAFATLFFGAWGFANTLQSFAGNASFAFPLAFIFIGLAHLKWLTEAPVNPMTRRDEKP